MTFEYTATASGVVRRGLQEAASAREVVAALRAQGLFVLRVREYHPRKNLRTFFTTAARVSLVERALLARHLALMLRSGLTVDRAFQILVTQASRRGVRRALQSVHQSIQHGEALSVACARFPRIFNPLFISVLKWGEAGGELPQSLERLADQLERDVQLRSAVQGALMYPVVVVLATFAMSVVMGVFVFPRLFKLFETLKVELPIVLRIFRWVSQFVSAHGVAVLFGSILAFTGLVVLLRLPRMKGPVGKFVLTFPVFGKIIRDVNLARTERILGSLLHSGLPVLEALSITSEALTNVHFRDAVRVIHTEAQRGVPVSSLLSKTPRLFPILHTRMVAVGEETGRLPDVLIYLAEFTEQRVSYATKNLVTVLEPILLIVVGLVVGSIALSVLTPIYQLTSSIGQ